MTSNFLKNLTTLTNDMIFQLPICDIHVHLPGVISPNIAWSLGIKNKFITINKKEDGIYSYSSGPKSLSILDPHEHYIDIFKNDFKLDTNGNPINLEYNIDNESFKSFDRIMATIQGHRHPPGGIQTKEDMIFLLDCYLEECVKQKIFYTELQQNIKIAYLLFPKDDQKIARKNLFLLFKNSIDKFKEKGVHLRFLHCFNKTKAAGDDKSTHERTIEAANWLEEAQKISPDVFVGIQSAGHEKDESGWPIHLKAGYEKVKDLGLGCEAHGGEGIGVEHMFDVARSLPITRLAHGFQVIEDHDVINFVKQKDITLIMMPIINLNLGLCVHMKQINGKQTPCSKSKGGKKIHIRDFWQHPFFELFRKHKMKITLSSDNPNIGGIPLKETILIIAGLNQNYQYPNEFTPIKAEELAILCKNGIDVIFAEDKLKQDYNKLLNNWIKENNLNQKFISDYYAIN